MLRKIVKLLFIFVLLVMNSGQTQQLDKNLLEGFDSIRPMDPYNYCKKMASAEFAGRLTGHEGYTKAANWAAKNFNYHCGVYAFCII